MSTDLLQNLPQHWIGIGAVVLFFVYVVGQVVEKYPAVAKMFPLGTWWHERQKRHSHRRTAWVAEDNAVIIALQEQVSSIANDLATMQNTVRCFRAWSIYDARWHHRIEVLNADNVRCVLPQHYDYFQFEKEWHLDPVAAARLAVA